MRIRVLAVLALVALTACSQRAVTNPFEGGGGSSSARGKIRLYVENRDFNEATVYSVATNPRRLGSVQGKGSGTFDLTWNATQDLSVRIHVLAGGQFTTNRLSVSPGEEVWLTIEQPLYRSLLRK